MILSLYGSLVLSLRVRARFSYEILVLSIKGTVSKYDGYTNIYIYTVSSIL
jgi:hypothetical protein